MALRASLPVEAVTITPGYAWRLDLDVTFDGERPDDWLDWKIRMHIWGDGVAITLSNEDGIRFDHIVEVDDFDPTILIPVIEMTPSKTELLRDKQGVHYLIDITAPDGVAEDYFSGALRVIYSPPMELLR